jgi:pimeloyl-ACP methyl ester carboxylesterase
MVKHVVKNVLRGAGIAVLTAGLSSWAYQKVQSASDARRFPAPGEMVDIGGRKLHVIKAGDGSPIVVVLPALGTSALEWIEVQRKLSADATVYLVDRGGLGWSESAEWPGTPSALSDELERLIMALKIDKPFVLIGHSYGGIIAQLYATRNPERLAGLMLMDSSHKDQLNELNKLDPRMSVRQLRIDALRYRARWLGLRRVSIQLGLRKKVSQDAERSFPSEMVQAGLSRSLTSAHRKAVIQEFLGLATGVNVVRQQVRNLGDLPLIVVTGGPERRERWHAKWLELQESFLEMSTNSTQVMALHAGHHVNRDDPNLLADAIGDFIKKTSTTSNQTSTETSPVK